MSHRVLAQSLSQGYSAALRSVFGFAYKCVCVCDLKDGEGEKMMTHMKSDSAKKKKAGVMTRRVIAKRLCRFTPCVLYDSCGFTSLHFDNDDLLDVPQSRSLSAS